MLIFVTMLTVDKKTINRENFTLDQVVCKMEGIKVADLKILKKCPELTRSTNIKESVNIFKQKELEEKQQKIVENQEAAKIRFREYEASLQREKEERKRMAEEMKISKEFEKLDRKRKIVCLESYKTVSDLLGLGEEYTLEINKLRPPKKLRI